MTVGVDAEFDTIRTIVTELQPAETAKCLPSNVTKTDEQQQITGAKMRTAIDSAVSTHADSLQTTGSWKGLHLSRVIPVGSEAVALVTHEIQLIHLSTQGLMTESPDTTHPKQWLTFKLQAAKRRRRV